MGQATQEAIELLAEILNIQTRTLPKEADLRRRAALWHNKAHDQPVKAIGRRADEFDGRCYVKIEGSETGVSEDEFEA